MGLAVANVADVADIVAAAGALGPLLRIFQVALDASYANATAPATNLSASIPWSRASAASVPGMSAMCYLFGAHAVAARGIPVGLMANAWGGVAIQVYMSPASLAKCGAAAVQPPVLPVVAAAERALALASGHGRLGQPTANSCLYYSMLYPLLSLPIRAMLWLQGESNIGDPVGYQCLQREMIKDWRASFAAMGGADPLAPFLFVQLSAWPTGSAASGQPWLLPIFRVAVEQTLRDVPNTGMAVSADIADASGAYHPIHPPWKNELARRAWLWADNAVYGNTSSPVSGPVPVAVAFDAWNASWGDTWHYGTGGSSYVCTSATWTCGGVRVTFDRPVQLRSFYNSAPVNTDQRMYGWPQGSSTGFELWQDDTDAAWRQRTPLISVSADGLTVQLNTTWIGPSKLPTVLKYAWQDYPEAMPLESADGFGLPVGPFNATLTFSL